MLSKREGAEAAVRSGDHTFAPDDVGVSLDALRDEAWVLDKICRRVDHPRDQDLVLKNIGLPPILPFMLMSWVGALEKDGLSTGMAQNVKEFQHGKSCV